MLHDSYRLCMTAEPVFSDDLEAWLASDGAKTLGSLSAVFAEKAFAVTILLLMFPAALPLPTGGITHVFEAITVMLAAQMVLGRRTVWLPARWKARELGAMTTDRAVPFMLRVIRRFERIAKPRGAHLLELRWATRVCGLLLGALATAAAFAPPFSGLDTLPALGVVAIALSMILGDVVILGIGVFIGAGGAIVIVTLGASVVRLVQHLL